MNNWPRSVHLKQVFNNRNDHFRHLLGIHIHIIEMSNNGGKNFGILTTAHFTKDVCLIQCPLHTDLTVMGINIRCQNVHCCYLFCWYPDFEGVRAWPRTTSKSGRPSGFNMHNGLVWNCNRKSLSYVSFPPSARDGSDSPSSSGDQDSVKHKWKWLAMKTMQES